MTQVVRRHLGSVLCLLFFPSLQACRLRVEIPLSDLLLQLHDDLDSHIENAQFGLRLVCFEVLHAHPSQLLQGFVYVPDSYPEEHKGSKC